MKIAHLENSPFGALSKELGSETLLIPNTIPEKFKYKAKELGHDPALERLIALNYQRRKIRIPWLFNNPIAKSIYVNRKRKEVVRLYKYYIDRLKEFAPDVLLIWNGSLMPASILKRAAEALGIQITYFEHGFFPGTVQIDNKGINGFNSVPTTPEFYAKLDAQYDREFVSQLNVRAQKNTNTLAQRDIPFESYIFVPMQVPSDMQILELSPWIQDMYHFYNTIRAVADLNPNLNFVVKEHPSFKLSIQKKVKPHPQIAFANAAVTETLIEKSDAVLTINSTVGIETISKGKPLISLGTAYYNIEGLVNHCSNQDELIDCLSTSWHHQTESDLRNRFLNFIKDTYLLTGSLEDLTSEFVESVRSRIQKQDAFSIAIDKE